jgi:hypothetical protein
VVDLKAECGGRYRIALDPSAGIEGQSRKERLWYYRIPCKFGHIYVHGKERLGAYASGRVATKLAAHQNVTVHQRGDSEVSVIFSIEIVDIVAWILGARRRRTVSAAQAEAGAARLAAFRASRKGG